MSDLNLFYSDIKKRWEDASIGVDDMMFAYTQDVIDLQARIAELEKAIREFLLIDGIKDCSAAYLIKIAEKK